MWRRSRFVSLRFALQRKPVPAQCALRNHINEPVVLIQGPWDVDANHAHTVLCSLRAAPAHVHAIVPGLDSLIDSHVCRH